MTEFLPILIIGAVMYGLLILPQQRRNKAHQQLIASVAEGDEILTSSGIYGFVKEVESDVLWVEVSPNTELKIAKSAVASKIQGTDNSDEDDDEPDESDEDE